MVTTLNLTDLPPLGETQVRPVDVLTARHYAERMTAGDVFPAISVVDDGETRYIYDGWHRADAARLAGRTTIEAEVETGTKLDALWRALGSNKTHGRHLTLQDMQHAVGIALKTYPEKLNREIAEQVGCSHSLVTKVAVVLAKRTGGEPVIYGRALAIKRKREAVRALVLAGESSIVIREKTGAHSSLIGEIRRELGKNSIDYSRAAIRQRRERMQELAATGHTSRQIAADVGLSEETVRNNCKRLGIQVLGDTVTRGTHRHDPRRILASIVADADNLTQGADLIDFRALAHTDIADALTSLKESRDKLSTFIRRLMQEQSTNGEAA